MILRYFLHFKTHFGPTSLDLILKLLKFWVKKVNFFKLIGTKFTFLN